jgi:hypothetical protein
MLNQSNRPLRQRTRKSAKVRTGTKFAVTGTSPIEIFAGQGGFSQADSTP